MLSSGRVVAEERMADLGHGGREGLEDVFMRVTAQPDYLPVAREIFSAIAS
jgi:hypothetical protein